MTRCVRPGDPMDINGHFLYLDGYSIEEFPDKERFIRLPSNGYFHDSHEMKVFMAKIQCRWLRNKLENVIDSYKVFQRFQNILRREAEKYGQLDFKNKQLEKRILQWLESQMMEIGIGN